MNTSGTHSGRVNGWSGEPRTKSVKPFSIMQWSTDHESIRKIYRGVDPQQRQQREIEALEMAPRWGLLVPEVLASGMQGALAWTIMRAVPGMPCGTRTDRNIEQYLNRAHALMQHLEQVSFALAPGPGWRRAESEAPEGSGDYLLDQLSERCRRRAWWAELGASVPRLEVDPTVYLHGDLKPEHLLVDGDDVYVVDWEACGRGPAVSDCADVVFHLIRDILYGEAECRRLPTGLLATFGAAGPILAWRLIRWLDRRRPQDIDLVPPSDVTDLVAEDDPVSACEKLARTVSALQMAGVPR